MNEHPDDHHDPDLNRSGCGIWFVLLLVIWVLGYGVYRAWAEPTSPPPEKPLCICPSARQPNVDDPIDVEGTMRSHL